MKVVTPTGKQVLHFESTDVAVELSGSEHINKLPFIATFMLIDTPSDGTPCGADFPVVLSMAEAQKCVDTMNLMGIDCEWDDWCPEYCMTGHNTRNKIGVVENAYIEGNEMKIKGIIYCNDFPDIAFFVKNATSSLGFSMECNSTLVDDGNGVENMIGVTFTGVAILFKNLAAYESTYIEYIAAQKKKENILNEEQMKALMDGIKASMEETAKVSAAKVDKFAETLTAFADKVTALEAAKEPKKNEPPAESPELAEMKAQLEAEKQKTADLEAAKEKLAQEKADLEAKRDTDGKGGSPKTGTKYGNGENVWAGKDFKAGMHEAVTAMVTEIKGKDID